MSEFLNDVTSGRITIEVCLQKLLVIAQKINNVELTAWCTHELNGYENFNDLPAYRKFKDRNIRYSGTNGGFQVVNNPIGQGFFKEETLKKIENIGIFDNIAKIEEINKSKQILSIDLTRFAGEVYKNTSDIDIGVSCNSICHVIPESMYSSICSNVKTRVINLLTAFDIAKFNIDKLYISNVNKKSITSHNEELYSTIVVKNESFSFKKKEYKILWNIIIPIITAVASGILVYLITNIRIK